MRTCIDCGSKIEIIEEDGKERYRCEEGHVNDRMEYHDEVESYSEGEEIIHRSVGAAVISGGKVLLLMRKKYPFAYTVPAGHLEPSDDSPEKAAAREIKEETGIEASSQELEKVFQGRIEDPCRRGADYHDWNFYVLKSDEDEDVRLNDEADHAEWLSIDEIEEMELTAPTRKFIVEKELIG